MLLLDKIEYEIDVIDKITDSMYSANNDWFTIFNDNVSGILDLYQQMINIQPALVKLGVEIPVNVLEQHIADVNEAIEYKDFLQLADVLKYEVREILGVFIELVKGGIVNNEELL